MIKGTYQDTPKLPFTLVLEISGRVMETGEGIGEFVPGDQVAVYAGQGGLAEYGCFDATLCARIPDSMPL